MARLTIGVHIGGTTTNAVILQGRELIAKAKHPTKENNVPEEVRQIIENVTNKRGVPHYSELRTRFGISNISNSGDFLIHI